jgi:Ca2+/H+ antiporter, TMEM165/GDT1 family
VREMELEPLVTAFLIVFITELGDKTMFAVILLSCKYSRSLILVSALAALALVSAIGVLVGEIFFEFVPEWVLLLAAGIVFLAMGLLTILIQRSEKPRLSLKLGGYGGGVSAFVLVALMELGDKSQISVIALSAESGAGLAVFLGAMIAFTIITLAEVMLGHEIERRVPERYLRWFTAAVFILFGLLFLVQLI